eukprot:Gregarina_sp_Poly_1__11313@NODE_946_length_5591_cov_81_272991_g670_i0_p6_GENE_NODE_946_length_5591_cov_81_272991_g670_i0NODE_946_length_5591_cov_81_272991_g670_i0_p6_ORF_typecomplete_len119_score12_06_NODE_946_length_5591_cov_81_272991_g670_i048885244
MDASPGPQSSPSLLLREPAPAKSSYKATFCAVIAFNLIALFPLQYIVFGEQWGEISLLDSHDNYFGHLSANPLGVVKSQSCWRLKETAPETTVGAFDSENDYRACRRFMGEVARYWSK